jgi:hypothetical protein
MNRLSSEEAVMESNQSKQCSQDGVDAVEVIGSEDEDGNDDDDAAVSDDCDDDVNVANIDEVSIRLESATIHSVMDEHQKNNSLSRY